MSLADCLVVIAAGLAAGLVNAVIGSGSLITFPTLVALGFAPITANVSNNIGLVPGSIGGAYGFRHELKGQMARARTLAAGSASGAAVGAGLLLMLPAAVFDTVVPVLVLLACVLMAFQPRLSRWVASRRPDSEHRVGAPVLALAFCTGIYGGYFGAAQGIILLAVLSVLVPDTMVRSNALKNVLAGTTNAVAAVIFALLAPVAWTAVALVATGSTAGGILGAKVGRRIPPLVLRLLVISLGLFVALRLTILKP